jgi:hypothetical protein
MRSWYFFLTLSAAAAGCRTPALNRELVEREHRQLEDRIYDLEDENEDLQRRLDWCLKEAERRQRDDEGDRLRPHRSDDVPEFEGPPEISPPDPDVPEGQLRREKRSRRPAADGFDADDDRSPDDLDGDADLDDAIDDEMGRHDDSGEEELLPDGAEPGADSSDASDEAAALEGSETVESLSLDARPSGDPEASRPAARGLSVLIGPRNADGRLVNAAAEVAVVVLDPSRPFQESRIARWDFTPEATANFFRQTPRGRGFHFDLEWPGTAPEASTLAVYVRYVTADGRKLVAQESLRLSRRDAPASEGEPTPAAAANFHVDPEGGPELVGTGDWSRASGEVARRLRAPARSFRSASAASAALPEREGGSDESSASSDRPTRRRPYRWTPDR